MDPVLVDSPAAHVARLLINNPERRNAIDLDVRNGLVAALAEVRSWSGERRVRAIVLGGVKGTFSSGGEVATMKGLSEAEAAERMRHVHGVCRAVASVAVPVVAAAEGFCVGGGAGLALLCDHVVVGSDTKFLFPFLELGLAPDWGLVHTLPRRVGAARAQRLFTSGTVVSGTDAVTMGLADTFATNGSVMRTAVDQAVALSQLPLAAFARMKARLAQPAASLEDELKREEADQAILLTGPDFVEGLLAFIEKRAPRFAED